MTVPFKVKAVYEYKSDVADDLSFQDGQIITVTEDDDDDWYTGEYVDASGTKHDGMFPRNFVEKYEPAIPTRPNRSARRPAQDATPASPPSAARIPEPELADEPAPLPEQTPEPVPQKVVPTSAAPIESKPTAAKQPPAVAEKPTTSSFRDRIAAFNKPAAAPITPFKPSGAGSGTGFVKKAFVAPPPSRNSYIPPPSQAPAPHKVYRREEDPEMRRDEDGQAEPEGVVRSDEPAADDQPKPTSLKDRIALLQQQQLEQAARNSEKKKVKKPPNKRTESADTLEEGPLDSIETPLARRDTGDTLRKSSLDVQRIDEEDSLATSDSLKEEPVITTVVPPPSRELVSDTNDADDSETTDNEDSRGLSGDEDFPKSRDPKPSAQVVAEPVGDDAGEEQDDTEDEDPEVRRRRELRERMAKMSGGMGMMGMFGPPGGMGVPAKKSKGGKETERINRAIEPEEVSKAPPVPVMALPGMSIPRRPDPEPERAESDDDNGEDDEDTAAPTPMENRQKAEEDDYVSVPRRTSMEHSLPQSPPGRSVPLPPRDPRSAPAVPASPPFIAAESHSMPARPGPPPPPPPPGALPVNDESDDDAGELVSPVPARTSLDRRSSTKSSSIMGVPSGPEHPETSLAEKRASRPAPPPIPGPRPTSPSTRAPPPPPPTRAAASAPLGLATAEQPGDESEDEVTEYDGDYDTDIASSAKHKDALRSHNRESSLEDDGLLTDDASKQPSNPAPRAVPPPPPGAPQREVPPLPPSAAPTAKRVSEVPRGVPPPPPVPTSRPEDHGDNYDNDGDYDPYKYSTQRGMSSPPLTSFPSPPLKSPGQEVEDPDLYGPPKQQPPPRAAPPPAGGLPPLPLERAAPPPPPAHRDLPPPPPHAGAAPPAIPATGALTADQPKPSVDLTRASTVRRSIEVPRGSADYGFIASDVELAEQTTWWTIENSVPPALQGRNDVLYEVESHTTSKRGGRATINRDIYVLYMDHSQTTINVSFDPADARNASLQQTHERPPPPPRPDQLESASEQFGAQIASAAHSMVGTTVADGTAHSFVLELLRPLQSTILMPIGTRSYGALVYANLANASTQHFDEIRPGDIVTFRNAKFAGHRGGLHAKYSMEVGKPDHVGVVIDWDGTKKKIRAWEQGREEKGKKSKVHEESFRVSDLKSGEVRVWRAMPRSWIGWDKS